jgi:hypothetical protein
MLGVVAGLVPGLSFTAPFQGLYLAQMSVVGEDAGPLRVHKIEPDSTAARSGFRTGDELLDAGSFDEAIAEFEALQPGERRVFRVRNDDQPRTVEAVGQTPQLAAVWYKTFWHPIAGGLFLGLALLVFATTPADPPPPWRSIVVGIVGFGLAAGFAIAWPMESVFIPVRVWQRFTMGGGAEWYFEQTILGLAAGLALAVFAAIETRCRLTSSGSPP